MRVQVAYVGFNRSDALTLSDDALVSDGFADAHVSSEGPSGIGTGVVELVIVGTVAGVAVAGWLANRVYQIRQRFRPLIIIDGSGADIKVEVRDDIPGMRGEVLIRSSDGNEIRIESPDQLSHIKDALAPILGID